HTRDDPADVLDPVHPVVLSVSAFFSLLPHPPSSTLFPYTTLFRSDQLDAAVHVHGTMIPGSSGQLVVNPAIAEARQQRAAAWAIDRKSTRLNSSHVSISYAVFCLKKKR